MSHEQDRVIPELNVTTDPDDTKLRESSESKNDSKIEDVLISVKSEEKVVITTVLAETTAIIDETKNPVDTKPDDSNGSKNDLETRDVSLPEKDNEKDVSKHVLTVDKETINDHHNDGDGKPQEEVVILEGEYDQKDNIQYMPLDKIQETSYAAMGLKYGVEKFGLTIEVIAGGYSAFGIGKVVKDWWPDIRWGNFAVVNFGARHVFPAMVGGPAFALLGTIFKYGLQYQKEKEEDSSLTPERFFRENLKDAMFFLVGLSVVGGLAFGVFTSTAELMAIITKDLQWQELYQELSKDALSVGFGVIVLASQFSWLNLPLKKLFLDIPLVFAGFAGGAYLVGQEIVGEWAPPVIGGAIPVIANLPYDVYRAASHYCGKFWSSEDKDKGKTLDVGEETGLLNDTAIVINEELGDGKDNIRQRVNKS